MAPDADLRLALLNPWQRGFPLVREPFAHVAGTLGVVELGRAVEALGDQFADPLVLTLGLAGIGLGLGCKLGLQL